MHNAAAAQFTSPSAPDGIRRFEGRSVQGARRIESRLDPHDLWDEANERLSLALGLAEVSEEACDRRGRPTDAAKLAQGLAALLRDASDLHRVAYDAFVRAPSAEFTITVAASQAHAVRSAAADDCADLAQRIASLAADASALHFDAARWAQSNGVSTEAGKIQVLAALTRLAETVAGQWGGQPEVTAGE